jgi:hypothetical protein
MRHRFLCSSLILAASLLCAPIVALAATVEPGFTSLFDGKSLDGWTLLGKRGDGYGVTNGVLFCAKGGGGHLYTEKEYSDFILRLEFRLDPGANNGIGIRCPLTAIGPAYAGMELQILDAAYNKPLRPAQYHGSIYDIVPAKHGALKPAGEWNEEEVVAQGRHIKVTVNGQVLVDANLNEVTDPEILKKHPGILRDRGHIGFLGHNDHVEFRNIRVKELSSTEKNNTPPEGFTALFNGKDLTGWKGLLARPNDNPGKRALLSKEDAAEKQKEADENMRASWRVEDGALVFSGKGRSLCTAKDYGDFEMLVDSKILAQGDTGIYLRGSPQVQIWDAFGRGERTAVGSGGLFNNKDPKNPSTPSVRADKPVGEWNRFRILMVGEKVHVFLNGTQVVNNVTMENYWEREKPIYPTGQIELQNHGNTIWFKNIYLRELPSTASK